VVSGRIQFGEEIFLMSTIQPEVFTLATKLQILLIRFMKDMAIPDI
jgi:hypothetical protein